MNRRKSSKFPNLVPILNWLPNYDFRKDLGNDIIGGLTVGFIHVPQGMAYASLAGLKPVNGLYTALFPSLIYMFFGTSRHVALGVFAVVSLMSGSCNLRVTQEIMKEMGNQTDFTPEDRLAISVSVVKSLALLIGLVQIVLGMLKAHYLISYLSEQVIVGFTTGAAVHVFTAQLNKVLGVLLPRHSGFGKLFKIYYDLGSSIVENKINYHTLIISLITMCILYVVKYHITPWLCAKTKIPIPYDLFVIIFGTIFSQVFALNDNYLVKIVGKIPTGLPTPAVPDWTIFQYVYSDAVAIAVVSIVVTLSMGNVFAKKHKYKLDVRQEFFALGMTGSICSLFPCWPFSTGLARTIINENAGTKTQLSAIFSAAVLVMVLFFIGPFLEHLPTCFLSCIVIVALRGMFLNLHNFVTLWRISKVDWAIFAISFFATVIYDVVPGLFIGTASALIFSILRMQRTSPTILEDVENSGSSKSHKVVIFYASTLLYLNCETFEKQIAEVVDERFGNSERDAENDENIRMVGDVNTEFIEPKYLILDMQGVSNIDLSGTNLLIKIHNDLKPRGIFFKIRNMNDNVKLLVEKVKGTDQLTETFETEVDS